ncbi:ATP-binding protein [Streptomyces sp. NPDC088707]|uniref:ATP-binding protein n=1 Tax=Streptomyces sp. NPDC088707 TaxID=3365871 RepID=UPI0037F2916D
MAEALDGHPGDVRRLELHGTLGMVSRSRDFTAEALAHWGWVPSETDEVGERVQDVLLLVSEVVGNACLHAGGAEELVLRHDRGRLRVEVVDASPEHPRARVDRTPAQPGGHGLMLLDRLAGDWGSRDRESGVMGKVVWLEVGLTSRPPWNGRRAAPS